MAIGTGIAGDSAIRRGLEDRRRENGRDSETEHCRCDRLMQRISVIIPCYCNSTTLARAVESVCAQTVAVDEIVVVNDCSPETVEIENIVKNYKKVVYVRNESNIGLAASRNKGIEVATGEVVTFLDADDEFHPQKIEFQLKHLGRDTVVACGHRKVLENGRRGAIEFYAEGKVQTITEPGWLLYRNHLTGASLMVPKTILDRVGGYDPSLRSCEDFDLWLRLLEVGITIRNVSLPLYIYHRNANSLSKNYYNISYWELEVLKKHFDRVEESLVSSQAKYVLAWYLIKHFARYQIGKDERLLGSAMHNLTLLACSPGLKGLVYLIHKSRVLTLYHFYAK